MCGIFGWFGPAGADGQLFLDRSASLLAHRGPDDRGARRGRDWGLGFRRLAILDLSPAGAQPMSTDDGRFLLVYNGEVYNYLELRRELEREGVRFRGGSDTEVVLHMLARRGPDALHRLNGMFALALVDTQRGEFLLARDRLGVKPLYYRVGEGVLRFGSELKTLLAWPGAPRVVSPAAVVEYLALGYLPADSCIVEGCAKLGAGQWLTGTLERPDAVERQTWWAPELSAEVGDGDGDGDGLRGLLESAVEVRLRSDVPVGVFLSGGLDSGVVAALAGAAARSVGVPPPLALTVAFTEASHDESALAAATARAVGLPHRVVLQRPSSLDGLDRLAWFYDEPFGDPSALPSLALSEAAADVGTVFLSGDGGDEAFGGYRRYVQALRYLPLSRLPAPVADVMRGLAARLPVTSSVRYRLVKATARDSGYAAVFDGTPEDPALALVLHPELREHLPSAGEAVWRRWADTVGQEVVRRQRALDYRLYLPDDVLVKVDRASMAESVEVRSPFLDHRVVAWAGRRSTSALVAHGAGKRPLRALARSLLPDEVLAAPKRGFGVPVDTWLRSPPGRSLVAERLVHGDGEELGWWDPRGVERLLAAHVGGRSRPFGHLLWRLLVLDAWARHYVGDAFLVGPPGRRCPSPRPVRASASE